MTTTGEAIAASPAGLGSALELMRLGGWVMWPLLGVSVVTVSLSLERAVFWTLGAGGGVVGEARRLGALARREQLAEARGAASAGRTPASLVARAVLSERIERGAAGLAAVEAIERARAQFERFSATLSTIITAAPMLGILGTVTGIIASFRVLGLATATDSRAVASGVAEALITTAFGLIVAIFTLMAHSAFRARSEAALASLELMGEALVRAREGEGGR